MMQREIKLEVVRVNPCYATALKIPRSGGIVLNSIFVRKRWHVLAFGTCLCADVGPQRLRPAVHPEAVEVQLQGVRRPAAHATGGAEPAGAGAQRQPVAHVAAGQTRRRHCLLSRTKSVARCLLRDQCVCCQHTAPICCCDNGNILPVILRHATHLLQLDGQQLPGSEC